MVCLEMEALVGGGAGADGPLQSWHDLDSATCARRPWVALRKSAEEVRVINGRRARTGNNHGSLSRLVE